MNAETYKNGTAVITIDMPSSNCDKTRDKNVQWDSEDPNEEIMIHYSANGEKGEDEENDNFEESCFSKFVGRIELSVQKFVFKHNKKIKLGIYCTLLTAYLLYFIYCMQYRFGDEGSIILLFITCSLFWKIFFVALKRKGTKFRFLGSFYSFIATKKGHQFRKILRYVAYIVAVVLVAAYLVIEVFSQNNRNIQSFVGMLVLIFVCFIMSSKPSKVNWHPVFWSLVIQFTVATITLRTEVGYNSFKWLGDKMSSFFAFSDEGSRFVIGKDFDEMGMAFSASGGIIFINACIFLLNHWGVIEFIVLKLGWFLSFCLETGPVESVVAASNIFLGQTEAPLLIRPYLSTVTTSELHTIMTCGFASISGGAMTIFIRVGAPPNHLLTAAVISAPAALAISKLMYPETERIALESQSNIKMIDENSKRQTNGLNAFAEGAIMAVTIAAATWANMLAFVSVLDFLDSLVGWFGARAGVEGLSFDLICSYILFPLAFFMGVDVDDCKRVGSLIAVKTFANPLISYTKLGDLIENRQVFEDYVSIPNNTWHSVGDDIYLEASNITLENGFLLERSEVIATYAMCGFSAFTAIGIALGSLIPICPPRKNDIIKVVIRAFIAGNMASFATGAIAGVLYQVEKL